MIPFIKTPGSNTEEGKNKTEQAQKVLDFVKARLIPRHWFELKLTIALLSLFLSLYFFGEIVEDLVDKETLYHLDFQIQTFIERLITPEITRFMVKVTNLGNVYFIGVTSLIMFVYILYRKEWWHLCTLLLIVGGGEILLFLLKLFFQRVRPEPQIIAAEGYSFPSGHAFAAMIVYGFLAYLTWKLTTSKLLKILIGFLSICLILLIGMSRLYLNVHWLTDILGGYTAGFSWLLISLIIMKIVSHKKESLAKP